MSIISTLQQQLGRSPLRHRWQQLTTRDRQALGWLSAFLLAVLVYTQLWQPLQQGATDARQRYQQQQALLAYLQQHADSIQPAAKTSQQAPLQPEQLQGVITRSARQHQLQIDRLDPDSDGSLSLQIPNVRTPVLFRWLQTLQQQGIQVAQASLQRLGPGEVSASLSLHLP